MHIRATPLAIAFYVVFALWFTAIRYSSPSFYGWLLAPVIGKILVFGTISLFFTVVILAAWRGVRAAAFPRADAVVVGGAMVCFDLVWRFYLGQFAWDAFKLISIALDMATPAIAILGMCVVSSELKRSGQVIAENKISNG
ncbi:hypothetical protein EUU23_00405 [Sphingorhabdus sp. IMCC26285]|uniref:Uncharacterized protein n=1 Tax=Sphingorhabdus profundilacus TaxID=2509718 RepID=A0A6I4LRX3_9SPHN|nr:hypothetical protein [Sphingorhabdus profundilacus]MVZ96162.1 hypothetical protein [Sphingorhabdus profundilacus]